MTRRSPRINITRKPLRHCYKWTKNRNGTIHSIGGMLLRFILLSILSQKNFTNNRTRTNMTTNIYYFIQPNKDPATKHNPPSVIRSVCDMSTPRHDKENKEQSHKSSSINHRTRNNLYYISRIRIHRSPLLHIRLCFRFDLFHSYRISRATRHHWIHLSSSIPNTTHKT